jgi:hypothetical protein
MRTNLHAGNEFVQVQFAAGVFVELCEKFFLYSPHRQHESKEGPQVGRKTSKGERHKGRKKGTEISVVTHL